MPARLHHEVTLVVGAIFDAENDPDSDGTSNPGASSAAGFSPCARLVNVRADAG